MSVFERKAKSMNSQLRIASKLGKVMTQVISPSRYVSDCIEKNIPSWTCPSRNLPGKKYQYGYSNHWLINELNLKNWQESFAGWIKVYRLECPSDREMADLNTKPWIVAEVAHNLDGIRMLTVKIRNLKSKKTSLFWYGKIRDIRIVKLLPKDALYYFVKSGFYPEPWMIVYYWEGKFIQIARSVYGPVKSGLSAAKKMLVRMKRSLLQVYICCWRGYLTPSNWSCWFETKNLFIIAIYDHGGTFHH